MCKITCITNKAKNIQNRAMMCLFACTPKGFIVIYVDKTGLLEYTNSVLNSINAYICNSRPRKLGKSITANMLTAYYSKASDSSEMFSNLKINKNPDFMEHLNKYDVIHFDVQWCMMAAGDSDNIVSHCKSYY
jgi:hypothetical protein